MIIILLALHDYLIRNKHLDVTHFSIEFGLKVIVLQFIIEHVNKIAFLYHFIK